MLLFNKEAGVVSKEDQGGVEGDTDEQEIEDVHLEYERERHWRMVLVNNYGGLDDAKTLIHDKTWDVYVNEMKQLSKGGYFVEVVGNDSKKVL